MYNLNHRGTTILLVHFFLLLLLFSVTFSYPEPLFGQSYSRMEIGAQATSLTLADPISPTLEKGGFGARVTYNASSIFGWEVEGDFFPIESEPGPQRGGRTFIVLAGPKAGWRWGRVGLFLKACPGVANFSNVDRVQSETAPNGVPYAIVFPGGHFTHLALDLGGTMEINTSSRTLIRFDVSETLLRYGDRIYRTPGAVITIPGVVGNSLLVSAGFSYRLGGLESQSISVQNTRKWEIGTQYGELSLGRAKLEDSSSFVPLYLGDDQSFGGRLTYNFNSWLAIDSAVNYFYTNPHVGDAERGGKMLQGAFGPKLGFHVRRFGVFAKVRPGFLSYGAVHDNYFPPYPTTRLTHFAVDFGGVLEYYPSRRTILRFDLSHTAVFYGSTLVVAPQTPPFNGNFVDRGFQDNGMEFTTGFGWRF